MADYDIEFFCEECNKNHPAGIKISIRGGLAQKRSIGAFYAAKQLPPKVADIMDSMVLCPKTGKMFAQKDLNQIFLVPTK
jgi:hypothetical protein